MAKARDVRHRLRESLKDALRQRDNVAIVALRSVLSAIDNAGAVDPPPPTKVRLGIGVADVGRKELSRDDLIRILHREIDERMSAAEEYLRLGREQEANRLRAEAAVVKAHLDEGRDL